MKVLLDTIGFDSLVRGTKPIPSKALQIIQTPPTVLFLSIVSIWELSIQASYGRIELNVSFDTFIKAELKYYQIKVLPLTQKDTFFQSTMPYVTANGSTHRDPCDRLIIAQASVRHLAVVSADHKFKYYPINIIWE